MRSRRIVERNRTRRTLLQVAGTLAVVAIALASWGAVAEDVMGSAVSSSSVLTTPRDPDAFIQDMTMGAVPRPVVLLSRQDAVAAELLRNNRTMTETEVLRVAQTLCYEAEELGYDPLLLLAVIRIESNYNHLAISPVGAEGLMQLMPPTAAWTAEYSGTQWPERHSFDPVLNVQLGSRYLAHLNKQFKRMDQALTAYNRGPSATRYIVNRHGGLPPEIHEFYSEKVLDKYRELRARYGHLPAG